MTVYNGMCKEMGNQEKLLLGVDIRNFRRRDSAAARLLCRKRLYQPLLATTRRYDRKRTFVDSGDGGLILMRTSVDPINLVEEAIPHIVQHANQGNDDPMHLRFVMHQGEVYKDKLGWAGEGVNIIFRVLDSRSLKIYKSKSKAKAIVAVTEKIHARMPLSNWKEVCINNKETRVLVWAAPVRLKKRDF